MSTNLKPTSKVIQISHEVISNETEKETGVYSVLTALCLNGSIWLYIRRRDRKPEWDCILEAPNNINN